MNRLTMEDVPAHMLGQVKDTEGKLIHVVKRDGSTQPASFELVKERLDSLTWGLATDFLDTIFITKKVMEGVYDGVTVTDLDLLAAETCAYVSQRHPDYSKLAARVAVANMHKVADANGCDTFSNTITRLFQFKDAQGRDAALISKHVYEFVVENREVLDAMVDLKRDYDYDYFGFKTLERAYLLKIDGIHAERPQYMLMRVACGIHCGDIERVRETYDMLSNRYFTHATPTLFNAGTPEPQMSSCFLLTMAADSILGIYDTIKQCALISRTAGGIGVSVSNIRAAGSYIRGSNGYSSGLVPMLRVFNDTARYVDQGGGKRKGSFAMYLEPWHPDVFDFLDLRKNHGKEEQRARDLFYALWIPDLFMERVKANGKWTLFCPNEAPGLQDAYGEKFRTLYEGYEAKGMGRKTIQAQQLWFKILESQIETGTPYMLYKDAANEKSNQKNLGTIRSSNLCTEIIEYSAPDEIAVCNLASVSLGMFVVDNEDGSKHYDFEHLKRVVKVMTRNLNKVIDLNYYPVEEARNSNMRHRPIGLGVQGFADALLKMRYPFESDEARRLNKDIFETIYFGACEQSMELAKEEGPYETYNKNGGCPASKGILQFDMWNVTPDSGLWDWDSLKTKIKEHGMRNSLLVAPMPTASTAQILGNNEAFEPYTQNLYVRRTLSGEFVQINRHLVLALVERGLWDDNMKNGLIKHNGSVLAVPGMPEDLKELFKTCWEIKQKVILDMAADRGPFIDQSQSLNIHMTNVTTSKLSSMHFHGWQRGLKTGMYYLRTKAAADAIKFTVEGEKAGQDVGVTKPVAPSKLTIAQKQAELRKVEDQENAGECINCSG